MGQARDRGPFEVRKAQSIARKAEEAERRRLAEEAAEAALTPAQRAARDRRRNRAGLLFAAVNTLLRS